jgi:crossover junction endodeoxyribonuclease RuvC
MIILGVDPGFSATGYGVIRQEGSRLFLIDCGVLKMSSSQPIAKRIGIFHDFFSEKIKVLSVTKIALETPFLGKNAQSFLKLGYLRGILYLLAEQAQMDVCDFSPSEVKLAVTGSGGAMKEQVANVMLRLFPGVKMPNKLDLTDALAVAFCGVLKSPRI